MGAGNTDRVAVIHHNGAPGLGTLKNRDTGGVSGLDFRVVIVDGGGTDDQICAADILRAVSQSDRDTLGNQMVHVGVFVDVRPGDHQAGAFQHLGQWEHRNAADSDQMNMSTGGEILF